MKKRITYVLLALLAVVAFAFTDSSKAKAAEATPLYYLQITGITSEGNDFADYINFNQTKAPSVLKGDKLHVRARFMGYTKFTVITGKDGKICYMMVQLECINPMPFLDRIRWL